MNNKSKKLLERTGRVQDGNFGDRLCPKKVVSINFDEHNTEHDQDRKYRTEQQKQEAMHQRQEENAKVTGFIQNAIKSKINLDANHFRINNKKSIQICKKILGERSKKRVFEDLQTSKYEKEFNLQKLHEKYKHDRSG